jgi:hypothetical protein
MTPTIVIWPSGGKYNFGEPLFFIKLLKCPPKKEQTQNKASKVNSTENSLSYTRGST